LSKIEAVRYTLRTLFVAVAMISILSYSTNGFTTYTYESARRSNVEKTPVQLSNWQLQDGREDHIGLSDFEDEWLFVDFIFTRCSTICWALGSRYAQLQRIIETESADSVKLLSVSIDPSYDSPLRLSQYRQRNKGDERMWRVARPNNAAILEQIKDEVGIRVIPDGWGGYTHSDSVHIIKNGELVRILDWDSDELFEFIKLVNQQ